MKINGALLRANAEIDLTEDIQTYHLFPDTEGVTQLRATIHAVYVSTMVLVTGTLRGTVTHCCDRCLEQCENQYETTFEQNYDLGPYEEDIVLDEDIRQTFLLCFPMQHICQEGCKGLCPVCGVNRNTTQCTCKESEHETPFTELKKMKV